MCHIVFIQEALTDGVHRSFFKNYSERIDLIFFFRHGYQDS